MSYSKQYGIDAGATGDTVKEGLVKHDSEVDALYTAINSCAGLHKGTSAPADTDFLWFDSANNQVKYHDGSAWVSITDNIILPSGLDLASFLKGWISNCTPYMASTSVITIGASTTYPATVEVNGEILQNTAAATLDIAALADDTYYIRVYRDGATSNFLIDVTSTTGYSADADYRVVGTVDKASGVYTLSDLSTGLRWCWVTGADSCAHDGTTIPALATVKHDPEGWWDSSAKKCTPGVAGTYQVIFCAEFSTTESVVMYVTANGSGGGGSRASGFKKDTAGAAGNFPVGATAVAIVELGAADYITPVVYQYSGDSAAKYLVSDAGRATHLIVRKIG